VCPHSIIVVTSKAGDLKEAVLWLCGLGGRLVCSHVGPDCGWQDWVGKQMRRQDTAGFLTLVTCLTKGKVILS
jgi:hypothetical protein